MARDMFDDTLPDQDVAKGFYTKYEPKEVLGRGVSSTVRRCVEKETGKSYAVKIIDISSSLADGTSVRDQVLHEIRMLREVAGHPYIIELYDVFESTTFIFLIFELCRRGELFDYLTSVVTLSEKKTKLIMKQLFEALSHAHSMNIVHRDVKPENILLDDLYNVKLTDFGFATKLNPGEVLFDLVGTPGYLAPEVLKSNMYENGNGYGKEVDMWACGVIMYTLLVGSPPFYHKKQMVMLRNIMEGKYSLDSPTWNDITDVPKDLISKLLVTDPARRYTVDDALRHEFFQVLQYKAKLFDPRRVFRFAILCVRSMVRIQRLKQTPEPLSVPMTRIDPYRSRVMRKVIDGCAFRVYGHWVKKSEGQNRAALFEYQPKTEIRQMYLASVS
ncbi:phosphorylase b kinase gamma catalytic chain, skeletal muscle/heart isoform-like isoform X2 [Artemia franciscana]|uniref:phosphorylase kinase n=1 Tax=Artemia franciscana TaxID=6661 RepID=A0AA88I2N9_ARTSF|nr:hypothetical protein QYM36_009146 [Artemia franciscana]